LDETHGQYSHEQNVEDARAAARILGDREMLKPVIARITARRSAAVRDWRRPVISR
jgi:hypothetical protein